MAAAVEAGSNYPARCASIQYRLHPSQSPSAESLRLLRVHHSFFPAILITVYLRPTTNLFPPKRLLDKQPGIRLRGAPSHSPSPASAALRSDRSRRSPIAATTVMDQLPLEL
ncbi:hypothetical protein CI238_11993 [Colletotrichum incanum]|uniref:Uncharacterized protein n=1 Tax=Colletotrichum incanum TaxID=1573173 RepID=A0A167CQF1_COLIC|nr:hypothetical protein CI238_11993 [Colletotrichum incanum]